MTFDLQTLLVVIIALGSLGDKLLVWKVIGLLAGGTRAPTFPPSLPVPNPPVGREPDPSPQPVPSPMQPTPGPAPVVVPPVVVPPVVPPVVAPPVAIPPVTSGPIHKWIGKCSEFGGPHDTGSGDPSEGLAIVSAADIPNFQEVLLPGAHGDALFRQLNPDSLYLACRWNYSETPRSYLKTLHIPVRNPATGASAVARAVDWGPNAKTGRVADLSPGLMAKLGLQTDGIVEVDIPLPAGGPAQPAAPVAGGLIPGISHQDYPAQSAAASYFGPPGSNLVTVVCPWNITGTTGNKITINAKCASSLAQILNAIWTHPTIGQSQAKINEFGYDVFDGSYNNRDIAGTSTPSQHAYGAAIDWNAAANPQHATASQTKFKEDSLIVQAFKQAGWTWGGDWSPAYRDAMHVQLLRA